MSGQVANTSSHVQGLLWIQLVVFGSLCGRERHHRPGPYHGSSHHCGPGSDNRRRYDRRSCRNYGSGHHRPGDYGGSHYRRQRHHGSRGQ